MVRGRGEANETAARKQEKENLTVIPPTPMVNQRHDTGKSSLTRHVQIGNGYSGGGTKKKKFLGRFESGHKKRWIGYFHMGRLFSQKYFK